MAGPREDRVEIGYVARAHGIRGELRVITHDPESTTLGSVSSVHVGDSEYPLKKARAVDGAYLITLEGIADRNQAELLKGKKVLLDRSAVVDDGDVLLSDLVGCAVALPDGQPWGRVAAIETGPGQSRLVIHDGEVERLLPVVDELIVDIDLAAATIVVDPPEGLPEVPISPSGGSR